MDITGTMPSEINGASKQVEVDQVPQAQGVDPGIHGKGLIPYSNQMWHGNCWIAFCCSYNILAVIFPFQFQQCLVYCFERVYEYFSQEMRK